MSEELKPCPFCGGLAELDTSQAYRALSSGALGSRAAIYCTRCSAEVGFCYEDAPGTPREDIVNQVVDDWNRRSPSPDMREAVEAATKLVSQWEAFEAGYGNQEEAYYKLAKYARPHWEALRTALRSLTGAKP